MYSNKAKMIGLAVLLIVGSFPLACSILGGPADLERANGYEVEAPSNWERRSRGESDRAYALPSGNVATVVSSCNRNPNAPLDILTRQLLFGTRDIKVTKREKTKLGSNEGLHSFVTAKMEGKPFYFELFVLSKDGCVFDFSLLSPKEIPKEDSAAFQQFVASFKYGSN